MNNLTIKIPALKRPTLKEIQEKYPWIKSIEKDTSTESPVSMSLAPVLKQGETSITGTEYEKRIPKTAILGFQHMQYLEEHQAEFPELLGSAKADNFSYITFPGIVVVRGGGDRSVPCLFQYGARWYGVWGWLGGRFGSGDRVAVARKVAPRTLKPSASRPSNPLPLGLLERVKALEKDMAKIKKIIKI